MDMSAHCIEPQAAIRTADGSSAPPVYDLYAVSNHFGRMGFGHYTAFCRDLAGSARVQGKMTLEQARQQWYCLDDSSCRRMPTENVVSKAGYVLFYQLRR